MGFQHLVCIVWVGILSGCGFVIDGTTTLGGASRSGGAVLRIDADLSAPLQVGSCEGPFFLETASSPEGSIVNLSQDLQVQITKVGHADVFLEGSCANPVNSLMVSHITGRRGFYVKAPVSHSSEFKFAPTDLPTLRGLNLDVEFEAKATRVDRFAGTLDPFGCHSGERTKAKLSSPMALTATSDHIYISNSSSHVILDYNLSSQLVTVLAGSCFSSGAVDGTGTSASFNNPRGLVVVGDFLYVADRSNHAIRKVDLTSRAVTVFAGLPGTSGNVNGTGTAARFNNPAGLASDGVALYVADSSNHSVRKILLSDASVSTLTATGLSTPNALTFQSGFLYVTNYGGTSIRRVATSDGTSAAFATVSSQTSGITSDSTTLYYSDYLTHQIKSINLSNLSTATIAGSGSSGFADGVGAAASMNTPHGIVLSGNSLFVLDTYNHLLRRLELSTQMLSTEIGTFGGIGAVDGGRDTTARLNDVTALVVQDQTLYFSEGANHLVRKIDLLTGTVAAVAGGAGASGATDAVGSSARFNSPQALSVDGSDVFVVDKSNHKVRKIDLATGSVSTVAGDGVMGATNSTLLASRFSSPQGIVKLGGVWYLADTGNHTIRKIDLSGNQVTLFAGQAGSSGFVDHSNGVSARFNAPSSIATDGTYLYVADKSNSAIRRIDPSTSEVSTLAGSLTGAQGAIDGIGAAARFKLPNSLSFFAGQLFVSDAGNALIRQIDVQSGSVSTLAGQVGMTMDWDDLALQAHTVNPLAIGASIHGIFLSNHMNIRWLH